MITELARRTVLSAIDQGWAGPPYDPFTLAELLQLPLRAVNGPYDAVTIPDDSSPRGVRLEYNPNRPLGRLRFNIAHEIGHTLFPDVADTVRQRTGSGAIPSYGLGDAWQLEMLCNIAASEMLMPSETLDDLNVVSLDINDLMRVRARLQVSTEALLRRVTALTEEPRTMFAAQRLTTSANGTSTFRLDYVEPSRSTLALMPLISGFESAVLSDCTAIGFTAMGTESWYSAYGENDIQAVGLPPYPGEALPRVAGWLGRRKEVAHRPSGLLREVMGDALSMRGEPPFMVLQVVSDRARGWSGEFGNRLKQKYPLAAKSFSSWIFARAEPLTLGEHHIAYEAGGNLAICSLVAQEGFGSSDEPRLRYPALAEALEGAAVDINAQVGWKVHAPRIGTGHGRGHWDVIRELLDRTMCRRGIDVTVYGRAG